MKLSIIIPTFNSSKVLGRALDSIVNQTFTDWEVLVMDGASNDNTADVAKSYGDRRIKFFSEPDKGIYDAMNKGIKKSQGEWLYFLGSDDWLYDNDVLAYFFRDNDFSGYDVVYGEVDAPQLSNFNKGEWSYDSLKYNRCHQAIFYKKNLFAKLGYYNLKYKLLADLDFNIKWFLNSKIINLHVQRLVSCYSDGGASTLVADEEFKRDFYRLVCIRGRKRICPKLYLKYLDEWALACKKEGNRFIAYVLISYYIIYKRIHNL